MLLGEKGDIKLNNDTNNGNVNYCLLRHIRSAVNTIGKDTVLPRASAQIVSSGTVCLAILRPGFDLQKARYVSILLCYFRLRS